MRKLFYNAYILPHLDYCCVIWGNCSRSLEEKIVRLQLKWTPLEDGTKNARILMLYKIRNQEVNISTSHKLIPTDRISRNTNTNSFQIPQCNTTIRKESFYPRTIRDWNTLPSSVTSVSSLESFMRLLTNNLVNSSLVLNHQC